MDDAEMFKKELEKLMPVFNKKETKSANYIVGFISWLFIALFACGAAWIVGAMVGMAVSGYHFITKLLG